MSSGRHISFPFECMWAWACLQILLGFCWSIYELWEIPIQLPSNSYAAGKIIELANCIAHFSHWLHISNMLNWLVHNNKTQNPNPCTMKFNMSCSGHSFGSNEMEKSMHSQRSNPNGIQIVRRCLIWMKCEYFIQRRSPFARWNGIQCGVANDPMPFFKIWNNNSNDSICFILR